MKRLLLLCAIGLLTVPLHAQLNCSGGPLNCPGTPTGTGVVVLQTSPTLVTPILGVATATRVGFGAPADATIPVLVSTGGAITAMDSGVTSSGASQINLILRNTATATATGNDLYFVAGTGTPSNSNATALIRSTVTGANSASDLRFFTNAGTAITQAATISSAGALQLNQYGLGTLQSDASGNLTSVLAPLMTTIKDGNGNVFLASSATASAVDSVTVTNAATANPATVTIASTGTDTNINTSLGAKGSGMVQHATYMQATSNRVALTADWTCGNSGTVSTCTAAVIIGSGGGVPLTFTLPLQSAPWHWQCDGVVGQATAATANSWNFLTATNGATNVTASYSMNTAATAMTGGATTDQASTTSTVVIGPAWTLGGTATKMPFHIAGTVEGAAAAGTVLSLQLVAPTTADVVTIYRGASCTVGL